MNLSIEYCNVWNYLPRAASMATNLLEKYGNKIKKLSLIPAGGGVYEVEKDGRLIFSKKSLDRFPELDEIITLINEK